MGYDARKAALYNKLIKDGVSEDAALAQAGITDADFGNYAIGANGQMGSLIVGTGTRPDVEIVTSRNQPSRVSYDQAPSGRPAQQPAQKNITYTTTSTETVSGGGTTTIISNQPRATAASEVYAREGSAKQAEIDQFIKDNPSNFARRRQGLPPLTPEENEARNAKLRELEDQRSQIFNQEQAAKESVPPTVTTTPNTATTTTTVVTGTARVNEPVPFGTDEQLDNQSEADLDENTPTVANAGNSISNADTVVDPEDDPFEARRLEREQEFDNPTPTFQPEDLSDDPYEVERIRREQEFDNPPPTFTAEDVSDDDPDLPRANPSDFGAPENFGPNPVDLDNDPAVRELDEQSRQEAEERYNELEDPDSAFNAQTKAYLKEAQQQATIQDRLGQNAKGDWRVRLRIAPDATYLYQDKTNSLLAPLRVSDGVVFPYTPVINTNYAAKYDAYDLTHSNYRGYFYRGSQISDINIQATFTAQDTREAEYVLAVIHFFRSATKMFYGQDRERGAPPPLVYLRGYGEYQFNDHACVISNFQYNLPNDVDYISITPNNVGLNLANRQAQVGSSPVSTISSAIGRLGNLFNVISGQPGVPRGAKPGERADLSVVSQTVNKTGQTTYVPTKIDINITLLPVQTRSQVSKQFSVKEFSNGNLLKKGFW